MNNVIHSPSDYVSDIISQCRNFSCVYYINLLILEARRRTRTAGHSCSQVSASLHFLLISDITSVLKVSIPVKILSLLHFIGSLKFHTHAHFKSFLRLSPKFLPLVEQVTTFVQFVQAAVRHCLFPAALESTRNASLQRRSSVPALFVLLLLSGPQAGNGTLSSDRVVNALPPGSEATVNDILARYPGQDDYICKYTVK